MDSNVEQKAFEAEVIMAVKHHDYTKAQDLLAMKASADDLDDDFDPDEDWEEDDDLDDDADEEEDDDFGIDDDEEDFDDDDYEDD